MKEEEKARKEAEKAIKEAQKEEEAYKKALEKAQKDLESALAEDKQKLLSEIESLKEKLAESETREKRAVSMAQITKSGHVYIISNIGSFGENVYKIGLTRRLEPLDRVKELGDASVPFPFDVHAMIYSEDAPKLENLLHKYFHSRRVNKVNERKEFFRVSINEVIVALKKIYTDNAKLKPKFKLTKLAQASEYRQTLTMHRAIAEQRSQGQKAGPEG